MAPKEGIAPIYNATYSLFRLSPLYVPDAKDFWLEDNLGFHARRFTESIQSDNLRPANLVLEDIEEATNRAGPFQQCWWHVLQQPGDDIEPVRSADDLGVLQGLQVNVEYERATYTALLLNGVESTEDVDGDQVKLPLVCIRMPVNLRSTFSNYMAATFDTRMEPLQLNGSILCKTLESFLEECAEDEDSLERTVKEIQLSLSFNKPIQPMLRSIDIAIKREDVAGFLAQGRIISTAQNTSSKFKTGPFMSGLQKYLQVQVALNLNADQIAISKIACGAFALGREGKLKLFAPNAGLNDDGEYDAAAMASRRATGQVLQFLLQAAIGNT